MKFSKGFTLIELVLFLSFYAIVVNFLLNNFGTFSNILGNLTNFTEAHQIAKTRMEIIINNRNTVGFENFNDPCITPPVNPSILCQVNTEFTLTSTITLEDPTHKLININVVGPDNININLNYRAAFYEL